MGREGKQSTTMNHSSPIRSPSHECMLLARRAFDDVNQQANMFTDDQPRHRERSPTYLSIATFSSHENRNPSNVEGVMSDSPS